MGTAPLAPPSIRFSASSCRAEGAQRAREERNRGGGWTGFLPGRLQVPGSRTICASSLQGQVGAPIAEPAVVLARRGPGDPRRAGGASVATRVCQGEKCPGRAGGLPKGGLSPRGTFTRQGEPHSAPPGGDGGSATPGSRTGLAENLTDFSPFQVLLRRDGAEGHWVRRGLQAVRRGDVARGWDATVPELPVSRSLGGNLPELRLASLSLRPKE